MPLTPVKTPKIIKALFPNYVWTIKTNKKEIYLTFDDGPTPNITTWTLDILNQYNAKATFFCIGNNVSKYPDIFQSILNQGHAIGNHTQTHPKGWKTATNTYLHNIAQADTILKAQDVTNKPVHSQLLFRPPYGSITPKQGKRLIALGYSIVMWDILSFDWHTNVTKDECFNNVISKAKNGSIIVFHDSIKASKNMQYALPKVLEYYSKKGYTFKSLQLH